MGQFSEVLLPIDKARSTREGPGLRTSLRSTFKCVYKTYTFSDPLPLKKGVLINIFQITYSIAKSSIPTFVIYVQS